MWIAIENDVSREKEENDDRLDQRVILLLEVFRHLEEIEQSAKGVFIQTNVTEASAQDFPRSNGEEGRTILLQSVQLLLQQQNFLQHIDKVLIELPTYVDEE